MATLPTNSICEGLGLQRLQRLSDTYRDGLLNDTMQFWLPRALDKEKGGYLFARGRTGELLSEDKSVWGHGRFAWMLATLHNGVEKRPEWLEAARHGLDFLERHCIDSDGRYFFQVTRDGRPLRKRRYIFSECFAIIAMAAFARASGDGCYAERALTLLKSIVTLIHTPGALSPKIDPATRSQKGLAMPMILINVAQEVRAATSDPWCTELIDTCIAEIERDFLKPDKKCLLETVGPNGEYLGGFDGRQVNPGHSLEAGWFILEEARLRGREDYVKLGCQIIDWSFPLGWDDTFGGLLYFRDAENLPCTEYWHDMKFWWPHNEAVIAMLLAWELTGEARYAQWHTQVHDWAYSHFPDPIHGEWFGYLLRDGSVSTELKGNMWKSPYHLPRMQLMGWRICDRLLKSGAATPKMAS